MRDAEALRLHRGLEVADDAQHILALAHVLRRAGPFTGRGSGDADAARREREGEGESERESERDLDKNALER